ncbi:MAG: M18 family aminopeptidase [Chlorobi bacterium]|nr:M18 family aminopeptidase [Chlorobiota bacterium]
MTKEIQLAEELINFIYNGPTAFHVVENVGRELEAAGYKKLELTGQWELEAGGKYYTTKNGSAIFAFDTGKKSLADNGFKMICAHSDSPGFKIKPDPEMIVDGKLMKLNTEVYGGPILMSWLDRPLSIAGRVILKSDDPLKPGHKLVNFRKAMVYIPNLAIHLNRSVNDGVELNKQKDMLPLVSTVNDSLEKDGWLQNLVAKELQVDALDILDFDLFLYEFEKGTLVGEKNEFISSPKLDDLAMVHAGLKALLSSDDNSPKMLAIFDNEEVGSGTKQGAGSPVLKHIIDRIAEKLGMSQEDKQRALYNSFMISADMAHSIHPNQVGKHDPVLHPVLNGGPVIKIHANQKYTTDGDSGAVFKSLCKIAEVPVQQFVNRSDMVGGSTLGNVLLGQMDIRSVDVGNPMLSMHSVRELGGVKDHFYMTEVFKTFFNL